MTMSVTDLINEVYAHTGTDNTDFINGDTDVSLLLNRSFWDLVDRFKFREKETISSWVTVIGTNFYAIPVPFEAIQQISIEDINDFKHTTLDRMTPWEYENIFVNNPDTTEYDKPTKYAREASGIRLWKTPDQAYNMKIRYWTTLSDLDKTSNPSVAIPQVWQEIILFGAVARAFYRLGDYPRAKAAEDKQDDLIGKRQLAAAKEETDTHRGGVDVLGYDDVYDQPNIDALRQWPWRP